MASFCIPKENIKKMKQTIKDLSSSDQIKKLVEMSSDERISLFKKVISEEEARMFNRELEKAIASKRLRALGDWMKKNLDDEYRKEEISTLSRKFKNLDEVNSFLKMKSDDLASKKIGASLTNKETEKFIEIGKRLYKAESELGRDFGNINDQWEKNLEFGKIHKEMEDFTQSLLPTSAWRSFVQRIGRANMLASIKTPFLNIESNTIGAITEAVIRRFANWKAFGNVDRAIAKEYAKKARLFYKETGIDLSRMISFEDTVSGASKKVGEQFDEGKFAKGYTDFIFNKTLTTPDVAFGNFSFVDSANLSASRIAEGDAKKATEIFKDAILVNPRTDEGKLVRSESIASARRATYTDESWSSKIALDVREVLNKIPGLGDVLMPFVKTVANVAELGADYGGLGFVKAAKKGARLYVGMKKGQGVDRDAMRSIFSDIVRSGLGMTAAYAIVSQIDPDDFVGAYDPQRVKIDQLANTSYNAVRVNTPFGEKWISMDYFGTLGVPIVGMLYAKKYDKKGENPILGYLSGAGSRYAEAMPVNLSGLVDTAGKLDPERLISADSLKAFGDSIQRDVADVFTSRMIPGILNDLARASDDVQRDTRQKPFIEATPFSTFLDQGIKTFVQKIPYLRENLPIKYDALGRVMYESNALESLMFGARVRTARMDAITSEILRLRNADQTPNVKDLRFMNSTKVEELKQKTGDNFYEVAREYGQDLARKFEVEMKRESYKRLSDEEKKKKLDAIGQDLYERTLRKNGVRYR